ncbi:MAG: MOP flippase family protein [Breznakibacter sp.]
MTNKFMKSISKRREFITQFDNKYNFIIEKENLRAISIKGGTLSFISQFVAFIMQMVTTMVLARLITPNDYGLVGMVTAITGFMHIFRDLGLSTATVQKKHLTISDVSSLFWINVSIGFIIFILLIIFSNQIAIFYNEPKLKLITYTISLGFVISSLGSQHQALLQRTMKFTIITKGQIVSNIVSALIGIFLAINSFGYWSLIIMQLVNPLILTVYFWVKVDWKPLFIVNIKKSRHLIKFGSYITGFDIVNYISRNLDNVLIGKFINSAAVGLYSKAYQILMLPIQQLRGPLGQVSMPALSLLQNNKMEFKKYYLKFLNILSFISIPIVCLMLLNSKHIILFFLGEQWIESIPLFQTLALTAIIQPLIGTLGILLMAYGNSKKYFYWGIMNTIVIVISLVIGVFQGLLILTWSYTIANYLMFIPSLIFCLKNTDISVGDFTKSLLSPLISSIAATLASYYILSFGYFPDKPLIHLVSSTFIYIPIYFILYGLHPLSRKELESHIKIIREIIKI